MQKFADRFRGLRCPSRYRAMRPLDALRRWLGERDPQKRDDRLEELVLDVAAGMACRNSVCDNEVSEQAGR